MSRLVVLCLVLLTVSWVGFRAAAEEPQELPALEAAAFAYRPAFARVGTNAEELGRRDYRRVHGDVQVYNAPGGALIHTRPASDYWVSVRSTVEGWAEINEGQWVRWEQLERAPISHLSGVLLRHRSKVPLAFLPQAALYAPQPGGTAPDDPTRVLERYAVVGLFSEVTVAGTAWVEVGAGQWVLAESVARITPIARPAGVDSQRWVGVDLANQMLIAYDGTRPVFATLISSGFAELPTHPGLYHVFQSRTVQTLGWGTPGEPFAYTVEDVPYLLYFNGHQGLHGAYWHDDFGSTHSHGCVNLSVSDARWIYDFLSAEIDRAGPDGIWPVVLVY